MRMKRVYREKDRAWWRDGTKFRELPLGELEMVKIKLDYKKSKERIR